MLLFTCLSIHAVADEADFAQRHAASIAALKNRGADVSVTTVDTPLTAYANGGRWVADCACGSGVACELAWASRCFGCGAVYPTVVFPDDHAAIEEELVTRARVNQNWVPGETVESLQAERLAMLQAANFVAGAGE